MEKEYIIIIMVIKMMDTGKKGIEMVKEFFIG